MLIGTIKQLRECKDRMPEIKEIKDGRHPEDHQERRTEVGPEWADLGRLKEGPPLGAAGPPLV